MEKNRKDTCIEAIPNTGFGQMPVTDVARLIENQASNNTKATKETLKGTRAARGIDEEAPEGTHVAQDIEDAPEGAHVAEKRAKGGDAESHNLVLARKGEAAAAAYMERRGAEILERNWVCPFGEADIVCKEDDCLVFVEVKTRSNIENGLPAESVTAKKRAKYERIAACYLRDNVYGEAKLRFDVIGILVINESYAMIRHYVNAFGKA